MTLKEAYEILEVDEDVTDALLKANYRWLMWFNHPDTKLGNDTVEFGRVLEAYILVRKYRDNYGKPTQFC